MSYLTGQPCSASADCCPAEVQADPELSELPISKEKWKWGGHWMRKTVRVTRRARPREWPS